MKSSRLESEDSCTPLSEEQQKVKEFRDIPFGLSKSHVGASGSDKQPLPLPSLDPSKRIRKGQ